MSFYTEISIFVVSPCYGNGLHIVRVWMHLVATNRWDLFKEDILGVKSCGSLSKVKSQLSSESLIQTFFYGIFGFDLGRCSNYLMLIKSTTWSKVTSVCFSQLNLVIMSDKARAVSGLE